MSEAVIIYGATEYGLYAKSEIEKYYPTIKELIFCDTATILSNFIADHPTERTIYEEMLLAEQGIEIIIVSAGHREQRFRHLVEMGIPEKRILKDWRWLSDLPYTRIAYEITGGCNARCKYCPSGRHNLQQGKVGKIEYASFNEFVDTINYLRNNHIIVERAIVDLFNWGEPFLNPDFPKIAVWLSEQNYEFTASTNASIPVFFNEPNALNGLKNMIFSMPGFSQESYDRIHGFEFERIKKNITDMVANFRAHGFDGNCKIAFHIYQFNFQEIKSAKAFAEDLGIGFYPYFAIPAAIDLAFGFIDKTMEYSLLRETATDLMTFYIDELVNERPEHYSCLQDNLLTINEKGELILGCCADQHSKECKDNYCLGSIKQMNLMDVKKKKQDIFKCTTCKKCRKIGADYFGSNGGNRSSEILRDFLMRL